MQYCAQNITIVCYLVDFYETTVTSPSGHGQRVASMTLTFKPSGPSL